MPFLVLLLLLNAGLLSAPAQNADPTETAPGAGPTAAATTAATAVPTPAPAAAAPATPPLAQGPNLVSNGDFETDSKGKGWPDGWPKGAGMTWEVENGKHFLRLVSQSPGQMLTAYREVPLDPSVKGVEISIRHRTAGVKRGSDLWNDARAVFHFVGADKKPIPPEPKPIIFSALAKDWTEKSIRVLVPPGAVKLVLMPSLFKALSGTLDLAEVRVVALDDATLSAMLAEEAEKQRVKDEQAAQVEAAVAAPALSPELKVSGNALVTPDGKAVWLQGVNVPSLEWSPTGDNILWTAHVALFDWKANALRLPVLDNLWFGYGKAPLASNDRELYRQTVDKIVKMAAGRGAYVILDLHRFLAPGDNCVDFWKDAAARYKNNPAVLFDIFNEPHDISWEVWRNGGTVEASGKPPFHSPGMQGLVDAVRGTGAKNIIVAGGLAYAYDLTGILKGYALDDKGGNGIMYATHFYNWHKGWAEHFLAVAEKYPVLVGETGADTKKMNFIPASQQEDPYTWVPDALGFIQKYRLNWTAFSLHTGATPVLISDWNYTPTPFWGVFVKEALSGKQFEMKSMR